MKKRITCLLLAAVMVCTLLPVSAFAASGKDGAISWSIDEEGTLTISGTGAMNDYSAAVIGGTAVNSSPWGRYSDSIKSVVINSGVTGIGNHAFCYCVNLEKITIPETVQRIGGSAFLNCGSLTALTIPASVTEIGDHAFCYCIGLTDIKVPDSVQSIGDNAFYRCTALNSVTIGNGVQSIGDYSFYWCTALKSVALGSGVRSIGEWAFFNCNSLVSLTIPDGVTSIGDSAFTNCTSLESINIPDGVTYIGESAFHYCKSLTSIAIPDSLASIEEYTFEYCSALDWVTMGIGVRNIGRNAFANCQSLRVVNYAGTWEQWNKIFIDIRNEELLNAILQYHKHSYTENVTKPSCTARGYTTFTCACGLSFQTDYTPALGHSYENGICTRCGELSVTPRLTITTSAGKPKLSWNAIEGATKYWIYRSTDGENFKYYDMTTNTTYTNKSTSIGTAYYYKVKAVTVIDGQNIASDYSEPASIMCAPSALTVSISRSNGKPKLSWSAVSGATKYWIYRSTDGGKTYKYYDCTTKTSYTNTGAASGTTYYYKVKAVAVVDGNNVTSAYSSAKSLFTSLATPTVKITTSNGKPKLTWNAVTGVDKYYIYRSTDGKNFSYYDSTVKTSYTNTSAKKGTKYYYKVKAVCTSNSNANSAQSKAVSIKTTK